MSEKKLVLKKIKEHYALKNDAEFARFLGIKPNTLSNWYSRNTMDYELIVSKCKEIDANWLLTGLGSMVKQRSDTTLKSMGQLDNYSNLDVPSSFHSSAPHYSLVQLSDIMAKIFEHNNFIPQFNDKTIAGIDKEHIDEVGRPIDYYSMPNMMDVDGAIVVSGDTMSPILQSGDVVFYRTIDPYQEHLNYGEIYLLDVLIEDGIYTTLKRVEPSKNGSDWIRLVSCNRKYSARDILLTAVKSVSYVRGYLHLFNRN